MLTPPKPTTSAADHTNPHLLAWIGLALLLIPWLVRAMTNLTPFPSWDLDPLAYSVINNSLTPPGSLICDGLSMLGSALLLIWAGRRGIQFNPPIVLLAFIGAIAVILHAWFLAPTHGSIGDQRIGAAWLSAIFGAVALWHAAQVLAVRRIAAGAMLGFIVLLAIYGAVQVFYSEAEAVADFQLDPERFLAAHGWSKDSPMAKAFIRRLIQPEAIGWFGLANVYATFAAAGVAFGAILLATRFRERTKPWFVVLAFTIASALALYLAHSKGGNIALAAAAGAAMVLALLSKRAAWPTTTRRRLAGLLGLAAIAGPIALIILRGQIGERLGELSLFFRWFYIQAATRIFAEHPVIGVGPDGFQRAFTIAKPPLCPEEVSSPHGVIFDWTATLGVLGIAWVCILARLAWHASARAVATPATDEPPPPARTDVRAMILIPITGTLLATWIESALITPEIALTRVIGLVLWAIAAWAIARMIDRSFSSRLALAGAAIALIAHGQIDVTGSLASSVGLWFGLIALAAAPDAPDSDPDRPTPSALHNIPGALIAAFGLLTLFSCIRYVRPWEHQLAEAAETVHPLADFSERLTALNVPAQKKESPQAIIRDLGNELGHAVQPNQDAVRAALIELERRLLPTAAKQLIAAFDIEPSDRRPLREASRLHLRLAEQAAEAKNEPEARREVAAAVDVLQLSNASPTSAIPSSGDWHWLASVHEHAADLLNDPAQIPLAIAARHQVAVLDPYNLENAKRLVHDYQRIGDQAETKTWAAQCLKLNEYMRLDRETRGLSDAERDDLARIAQQPG